MRKIIVFLLSLTITFTPTFLWAGAAEKWEILENVYDQSSQRVNVTARKITQEAANSGRYKVQVPVNASVLGATAKSMLWTGVAVAALEALIGAVGWIIDEGSKTIKKLDPDQPPNPPYIWITGGWTESTADTYVKSGNLFAKVYCKAYGRGTCTASNFVINSLTSVSVDVMSESNTKIGSFSIQRKTNPNYDPNLEPRYIPVSDQELGDEIMGNGTEPNSRPTPETGIITQAYDPNNPVGLGEPAPKATDDALNSANPEPDSPPKGESETKTETDPETGETTEKSEFTLPNFCSWAPAVCDFFKVQKQDNKEIKQNQKDQIEQNLTFFEKVTDFFDWSQEPPDLDQDEIDIQEPDEFDTSVFSTDRFSVSRQCPVPEQHTISLSGVSVNFSFDLTPLCQVLEFARPALVACSYLYAAYIVVGAARNG
ncbi:hypothetical protein C3F34_16805 [Acinetobacter sp. ACNIH2]|uniref:virulence factor TspB C-terminal domain-related protein n=1 Tax=Acinetobacter sp. ACNIH2 TaxID=1758189 RepID=UPI000CDCD79B|nr:virulence factor TspB C-terminal domain-related protein [Acinetobacter sp. ACNIH2]AUX87544.1 hypothetical protein C3F34_16805 [Acinetobacter sp. ACNIH2]